ncbi:MAG TPA: bacteriohopanetetrol glucosamine biosynthesis glycosyltransferase HpnI, partial [Casimicrobiaceae bacterium]|nr:bacteriohopanetetrol glucosamine biosynthesis glycosyltransferase HpnI [Casimicrobiaceae bacterium]
DADDEAAAVVDALIAIRPGRDLELCITGGTTGSNPKVANLCGMQHLIRHDVVVIADSDIAVAPDYLQRTVAALEQPGVGAVTYLYRGVPHRGVWAKLAAMAIDCHFVPNALVGVALGLARPCFGSTIALRRETLTAIGGFDAFREQLADDYAMGAAVRQLGMRVAIPPLVVEHSFNERTLAQLLRHELRWARTVRVADAAGYAGLALTHPLPFAIVATALEDFAFGVTAIVASIACRLVLQRQVEHTLATRSLGIWLGPVRDLLSFVIYCASFFVGVVSWRGHRYKVRSDGTLLPLGDHKA